MQTKSESVPAKSTSQFVRELASKQDAKRNIEWFLDSKADEPDKFQCFNEWCAREGVIMPKLEYPAWFGNGLLGVRVKQDIQHREAYLAVPNKMLMSLKKAKADKVLGAIIAAHPEAFTEDENDDWEQFILCIFIFYEMTKGRDSYWYPYLRLMPDVEFTSAIN